MSENDKDEALELLALDLLNAADGPIGAAKLAETFQSAGHNLAQATAGRFLRQLDLKGLTRAEGAKLGRVVTEEGVQRLNELKERQLIQQKSVSLMRAATINDLADLHDLLLVRRAVESEGAMLAAQRGENQELDDILAQARTHLREAKSGRVPDSASSVRFHRAIAEASHNPMLISVALILLEPQNPVLTDVLEDVSIGSDKVISHAEDHVALAEALVARDAVQSRDVMYRHLSAMIAPVETRRHSSGELDAALLRQSRIG